MKEDTLLQHIEKALEADEDRHRIAKEKRETQYEVFYFGRISAYKHIIKYINRLKGE